MKMSKDEIQNILTQIEHESTCIRRKVGAFLIDEEGHIEKAYNGNLEKPCSKGTCLRDKLKISHGVTHSLCYGIHAEIRLILKCLEKGMDLKNASVYCTYSPCVDCATVLAMYKIKAFYYLYEYPDNRYVAIFKKEDIKYGLL